jgi:hypothetical protein
MMDLLPQGRTCELSRKQDREKKLESRSLFDSLLGQGRALQHCESDTPEIGARSNFCFNQKTKKKKPLALTS